MQVIKSAHLPCQSRNFAARQALVVLGDADGESNFNQLLRLQSKTFPELTDWQSKKTERYTSHDVQNEIINLMSNQISRSLFAVVFFWLCVMSTTMFLIKNS